ncbi:MAG TPA: DEAD/DEAH box helicase [Gammaproteobacteria bacterium]|nr:DEAD/DEAH box helicase [Gammaproteobacteria bacterium]
MPLSPFHPAVAGWFERTFSAATDCQQQAWPAIRSRRHALIAAPTGSGKTLAAFLCAIDDLVRQGLDAGLEDKPQVVYVSPLRALSNDVQRNLMAPLAGIRDELLQSGLSDVDVRTFVRTGDTPAASRALMKRHPPHIIVTTPESLYLLLTSDSGSKLLESVKTVIVDEIHAIIGSKRGAHLSLSLERLAALTAEPPVRIGLSATQRPIEAAAAFLTGADDRGAPLPCAVIDLGHRRQRDLAIEMPRAPLEAVMSGEVWNETYDRLTELVREHRSTLVFVNTRRLAERLARHLSERLGEEAVTAHHGSLSREQRFSAEQRLKDGKLRVLVATASLELGIDIGQVDLVCQIGTTRSISTFLQRAGRAGHAVHGTPKARLFPLSRDELVEGIALLDAVRRGELDALRLLEAPLDVLAQQIVATVAMREWDEQALYGLARRAWPYRNLNRDDFDAVVRMLAEGISARRGRMSAYLHRDAVNGVLRARRGAKLTAVTCGGAIPDNADYEVREQPQDVFVGTVNEDFAVESMAGDIFQLGNTSWRIQRVEPGVVRVENAHGQPPTIPFWIGEAPARTAELSLAVSRLRASLARQFAAAGGDVAQICASAATGLMAQTGVGEPAARQAVDYLWCAWRALGALPTREQPILERFFDESGGMQLVLHAPYGGRLNRAWGLSLRKCFCRQFNFELQAAATEDAIVLSLGETHSFPLEDVWRYLNSASVHDVLTQAVLDAPLFNARWRWVAAVALAIPRFRGGSKVPPRLQRMLAEDLSAVVFPDQLACLENVAGRRQIPDHPLVAQTLRDCLTEAMDIDGLERLLKNMERGAVAGLARDLTTPSPLAAEILNARPYAFLDDAPLEERRTQAVISRRWFDPRSASDLSQLDPEAIARVRAEAWPDFSSADELHDALLSYGFLAEPELSDGGPLLKELRDARRAWRMEGHGGAPLWIAVERLPRFAALFPALKHDMTVPADYTRESWTPETGLPAVLRDRLQALGPVTAMQLAAPLGLPAAAIATALAQLEAEGFIMRGRFTPGAADEEWCERRLLARIHRYTVEQLRAQIAPVSASSYLRFLFRWQHVDPEGRREGVRALAAVLGQLEGFIAPAGAWEQAILPVRVRDYHPGMVDELGLSGRYGWARPVPASPSAATAVQVIPVAFFSRRLMSLWRGVYAHASPAGSTKLSANAARVLDALRGQGAAFTDDLIDAAGLLAAQVEEALVELIAAGRVTADSFGSLRSLARRGERRRRRRAEGWTHSGRWVALPPVTADALTPDATEMVARTMLGRYGVVFRRLCEREPELPPWRLLLDCLRRLEARGEIRGGRFIAGFAGEQFALNEAVAELRHAVPAAAEMDRWVVLSAADPLNLVGLLTPGPRVPAVTAHRMLYEDGMPIASLKGGEVQYYVEVEARKTWQIRDRLAGPLAPASERTRGRHPRPRIY